MNRTRCWLTSFARSLLLSVPPSLRPSVAPSLPLSLALAACLWLVSVRTSSAQTIIVRNQSCAGTAFSADVFAMADMLRASGDFIVATGTARKLHAQAASIEMDNEVKWVNTYFERRYLNRQWRAKEHPSYLERLEKQKETYRRLLDTNLAVFGGDKSEELNWMLREILANSSYADLMSDASSQLISSGHNALLSDDQRRQILVTEGKLPGKKSLILRVVEPQPLETRWPLALREERFDNVCKAFEDARDLALADVASKQTGHEVTRDHRRALMKAVDALADEVAAEYRERPTPVPPADWLSYKTARCFVESLAVQTFRMFETESTAAYDGSLRFTGKTVGELLQHMMSKGLQFAPPNPGGEPTYEILYNSVRGFYLELVPKPEAEKK